MYKLFPMAEGNCRMVLRDLKPEDVRYKQIKLNAPFSYAPFFTNFVRITMVWSLIFPSICS